MGHLLVTNDFPPKVGGIQTYLGELWTRLPAGQATVLTTAHAGAPAWDAAHPLPVHRLPASVLLPRPALVARVRREAAEAGVKLVVLDPALPARADRPRARPAVRGRAPRGRGDRAGAPSGQPTTAGPGAGGGVGHRRRRCLSSRRGEPDRGSGPAARGRRGAPRRGPDPLPTARRRRPAGGEGPPRSPCRRTAGRVRQPARAPQGRRRPHRGHDPAAPATPGADPGRRRHGAGPRTVAAPGRPSRRAGTLPRSGVR